MMKFEGLPNEIVLDLFEFFDPIQLIRAFQDLNIRFEELLFIKFHSYRLDFRSISKCNFHLMCKEYLPLMVDNVSSLCLSDGEETPQLSKQMFSYRLTIDEFSHLQALLLQNIDSTQTILDITSDCFYLPYLTHFKIIQCQFEHGKDPTKLFRKIWCLRNLTHCTLDIIFEPGFTLIDLPIISNSIEYLSLKNVSFSSIELSYLLNSVPNLRYLSIKFAQIIGTDLYHISSFPSITNLQLDFDSSVAALKHILKSMPNLLCFTFKSVTISLNGHQWKQILSDFVPELKRFRFLTKYISSNSNLNEQPDEILNSFRTPFWIDQHQWFVRCDWQPRMKKVFFLYTLPYCFDSTHIIHQNLLSITTSPNGHADNSFDQIADVFYKGRMDNSSLFPVYYPNVRRLILQLPVSHYFWTTIPTFAHLTSLEIFDIKDYVQSEFQLKVLLNRAPRLESLSIDGILFLQLATSNITHPSLHRIQLKHNRINMNRYLNAEQCCLLANSFLGRQCEVLSIQIDDRNIILDLVNKMCNLRALNVACRDDYETGNSALNEDDEFIKWLKCSLPENYYVCRYQCRFVRLWIHR